MKDDPITLNSLQDEEAEAKAVLTDNDPDLLAYVEEARQLIGGNVDMVISMAELAQQRVITGMSTFEEVVADLLINGMCIEYMRRRKEQHDRPT